MLTDKEVAKAAPREKGCKLTDAAGLHVYVAPGGGKSWRLKYRFGGVERRIVFGTYPDISLKRAREMRDDARRLLRDGRDPGLESKRARHARTVGTRKDMAEALAFAATGKVKADIELQPLSAINAVFDRLEHGQVPSRVVLDFGSQS